MPSTESLAELREQMARKRAEEHIEAERIKRWDLFWTCVQCFAWCAAGLFLVGWAFHTTDREFGKKMLLVGVCLGNAGIIFTLLGAYRRGEKRGDW